LSTEHTKNTKISEAKIDRFREKSSLPSPAREGFRSCPLVRKRFERSRGHRELSGLRLFPFHPPSL